MKKTLIILLLFFASITTWAYDFKSGTLYYNITSNTAPYTVEVTYDSSNSGNNPTYINLTNVNIPQTVSYSGKQYAVTSIGDWTFSDCTSLTYINIPKSVTQIGAGAFSDCTSLISINIPNGIVSIGYLAFDDTKIYNTASNWENGVLYIDNCLIKAETDISGHYVIKNSTRLIADDAFHFCTELTSITIPNSVTYIGEAAFAGCESLTSINIPDSIATIRIGTFHNCSSLISITIPKSIASIAPAAFINCPALISIAVESGNTMYDSRNNCNAIIHTPTSTLIAGCQTTNIPNSVTRIDDYAFYGCSSLTSITIPNSVTSIGKDAFRFCKSLTSIVIPNSITSIGDYAFAYCNSLRSVTLPSIKQLGHSAFLTYGGGIECINQLDTVICYATIPPIVYNSSVFSNYNASLYVPCKSISSYQSHEVWKQFSNIQCIGIDFLEIPYDATSFTEEERNSNPERIIYPATLEDKDSVDMICEQVGGDCMEAVDLGLSVKWATCNVGASNPEDYGDYFAWGETEPKTENEEYYWSTYKWCNGSASTLTKYNNSSSYGTVDNKKTLELADDAARANWGGAWRMPTDAEMTELREQCTWTWTTLNSVNGYKVTGTNGNSIFLPAAGHRVNSYLFQAGSTGSYWSSSLYTYPSYYACSETFSSTVVGSSISARSSGYSVRPVCH